MAVVKTNVMRLLDKEKIPYLVTTYEIGDGHIDGIAVAQKIGRDPKQVFKTLVTLGHSKTNYVFLIPVAEELDFKKASSAAKEKSIEMLPLKELQKITGYIRGGCSPIGMKKLFKTYIHHTALSCDEITLSGGKIGIQITLSPKALERLIHIDYANLIQV